MEHHILRSRKFSEAKIKLMRGIAKKHAHKICKYSLNHVIVSEVRRLSLRTE